MSGPMSPTLFRRLAALHCGCARLVDRLQPLLALGLRLYVARVFLLSGLTKIRDWSVTLALFENEYHVPALSPQVAAVLGTATELSLPVCLRSDWARALPPACCSFSTSSPSCPTPISPTSPSWITSCGD